MKKCPYWSKAWSNCMVKSKTNKFTDSCIGDLNAGCVHFRTAQVQKHAHEDGYFERPQFEKAPS